MPSQPWTTALLSGCATGDQPAAFHRAASRPDTGGHRARRQRAGDRLLAAALSADRSTLGRLCVLIDAGFGELGQRLVGLFLLAQRSIQ
jgi:hypothetical protein